MNRVWLSGNLGSDPIRIEAGEKPFVKLSVATNDRIKKAGEYVQDTQWHSVIVTGKQADYVKDKAKKGSYVEITGRNTNREFTDKSNVRHKVSEVYAMDIRVYASMEEVATEDES